MVKLGSFLLSLLLVSASFDLIEKRCHSDAGTDVMDRAGRPSSNYTPNTSTAAAVAAPLIAQLTHVAAFQNGNVEY